jgi:hypothetical protein
MTVDEAQSLPPGLYTIAWHEGGTSLAAIGSTATGGRWLAPTNWVQVRSDYAGPRLWALVERAVPLRLDAP